MKFGETGHGDNGSRRMFFVVNFTYILYNAGGAVIFFKCPFKFLKFYLEEIK